MAGGKTKTWLTSPAIPDRRNYCMSKRTTRHPFEAVLSVLADDDDLGNNGEE
jgi:hypothetical protein